MTPPNAAYPVATFENRGRLHSIPVNIKVSQYALVSIIITALESGYCNHWCPRVRLRIPSEGYEKPGKQDKVVIERTEGEVWNEYIARNVVLGGTLTFFEFEEEGGNKFKGHTLTRKRLLTGMAKMFMDGLFLDRFDGVDQETGEMEIDDDGPMADAIIQYALFGERVYG